MASIRASTYDNSLSFWGFVFLDNTLDATCLLGSTIVLSTLLHIVNCYLRVLSNCGIIKRIHIFTWSKTRVPYAAGTLWPANALIVGWDGILLVSGSGTKPGTAIIRRYTRFQQSKAPASTFENASSIFVASNRINQVRVFPASIQEASRLLRHDFAILDERRKYVESMIYLVNLAVMADPVVLFRVCWGRDLYVCLCRSKATNRSFLVLQDAVKSRHDVSISWKDYDVVMTVGTNELAWQDLLHCGRRCGVNATVLTEAGYLDSAAVTCTSSHECPLSGWW